MSKSRVWPVIAFALAFCAGVANGQASEIEKRFDRARSTYKLQRFDELWQPLGPSEAGKRIDYLYYLDGSDLIKIRKVESDPDPGPTPTVKVDDYFFEGGRLQLVRLYLVTSRSQLNAAKTGSILPLRISDEHIEFAEGRLTKWIVFGKSVPPTDRRWKDKQTSVEIATRLEMDKHREFTTKSGH